jgi:hypothetical protein
VTDETNQLTSVDFVVTDEDVRVLRELRPRRMRFALIEYALHVVALAALLLVTTLSLILRRTAHLPMTLGVLAGVWLIAWVYLAFFMFRRSPESRRWFEMLRQSPVLSLGACRATLRGDDLVVTTPTATHHFRPADLEDCMFDTDRFFIRTTRGDAIIIPRRAFASQDAWVEFLRSVRTRDHP